MQALEGQADGRIILRVRRADRLQVEIEDNGPGIPEEIREQIFIPFFTTKRKEAESALVFANRSSGNMTDTYPSGKAVRDKLFSVSICLRSETF